MVMKFKMGDKVRVVWIDPNAFGGGKDSESYKGYLKTHLNQVGEIINIFDGMNMFPIEVKFSNDLATTLWNEKELEHDKIVIDPDGNIW